MCGADRIRLFPAQGVELGRFQLALVVVRLVRRNQDGRLGSAQNVGGFPVGRRQAGDRVDHEEDQVGLVDGQPGLLLDLFFDRVAGVDFQTTGIDHDETSAVPVGIAVDSVAGGSSAILDDGRAAANDPVEQCAFPDVRAADDGNDW